MEQKTAQQKAEERYPDYTDRDFIGPGNSRMIDLNIVNERLRMGYATCYREEVEPRDRIIQEAVDAIEEVRKINADLVRRGPMDTAAAHCLRVAKALLAKAKEQLGIEPSKP